MTRIVVFLFAMALIDQLVSPVHPAQRYREAHPVTPAHHFYQRCNVAVDVCRNV